MYVVSRVEEAKTCLIRSLEALTFPVRVEESLLYAVIAVVHLTGIEGAADGMVTLWRKAEDWRQAHGRQT